MENGYIANYRTFFVQQGQQSGQLRQSSQFQLAAHNILPNLHNKICYSVLD